MRVAEATGIPFHYHSPRRQSGDLKWKAEFENILKEQVISDVIAPTDQEPQYLKVSLQQISTVLDKYC